MKGPGPDARREHLRTKEFEANFIEKRNEISGISAEGPAAKRKRAGDVLEDALSYLGPWAGLEGDDQDKVEEIAELNGEELPQETELLKDSQERVCTTFHGLSETLADGRRWCETGPEARRPLLDPLKADNYIPKKHTFSYVGHAGGVNKVRFIPSTGHLLLTASVDASVKIWDVYGRRKCLRSYNGHSQACRDINFVPDGTKFYSSSFDGDVKLWDVDRGTVISSFGNGGHIAYCCTVKPDEPNIVIAGHHNNFAVQYDSRTGQQVVEYRAHMAPVNSVTFCGDNRKIMTTGDDKKVFVWEYGIPVVVKNIAEPTQYSCPSAVLHPEGKLVALQTLDNQITVYEGQGRHRFFSRRRYRGHQSSGYAIEPAFSTNGRFLMSGDQTGKLYFWSWEKVKVIQSFVAHEQVVTSSQWHPAEPSTIATSSWDGVVKLWK